MTIHRCADGSFFSCAVYDTEKNFYNYQTGGTAAGQKNRNHVEKYVEFTSIPFAMEEVLFDPQTSGGLLIAVKADEAELLCGELQKAGAPAKIVGEIIPRAEKEIYVLG